jgi:hypothetical protein
MAVVHGAQPFFRNQRLLSHSRNSMHFIEIESSLPYSQQPSLNPILGQMNQTHTYLLKTDKISLSQPYYMQYVFLENLLEVNQFNLHDTLRTCFRQHSHHQAFKSC